MMSPAIKPSAVLALILQPRTVAEIAARLGRPSSSVHHRLKQLRIAGLAKTDGTHDMVPLWVATPEGRTASAPAPADPRREVRGGAQDLLRLIAAEPGICAADAAKKLGRNQAGVNAVAQRLEVKGLVSATYAGRRRHLRVTAAGLETIGGEG